eukprot:scaffold5.g1007.t1
MPSKSVLDDLGEEVTGIVAPVSICMALTVALVHILNPDGSSDTNAVFLASSYYTENEGDSAGQKLSGSIINALIFVGVVAVMTFVLVLLFKYGYVRVIYAYMGFAGFAIFFVLTGIISLELLQKWDVGLDLISFSYILWNFAVVGAVTLFFFPAPLLVKQAYLIVTGVTTAFVFTWIPEWTTWVLLVAMAIYDVLAVLVPGGPLRVLVETAQERDEVIPALVYEARPSRRDLVPPRERGGDPGASSDDGSSRQLVSAEAELQPAPADQQQLTRQRSSFLRHDSPGIAGTPGGAAEDQDTPLIGGLPAERSSDARAMGAAPLDLEVQQGGGRDPWSRPWSAPPRALERGGDAGVQLSASTPEQQAQLAAHPDDASVFGLPEAIKLGLGEPAAQGRLVLVGRAAMYDFLTVFSCYLAIIAGLGATLLLLALARKALPALPISIALAVAFYFISRFVMEPVILPMTLELVYF